MKLSGHVIGLLKEYMHDLVEQASSRYHMDWAEYSWVRETDSRMVSLGEAIAGQPAKTYRIYAKPI